MTHHPPLALVLVFYHTALGVQRTQGAKDRKESNKQAPRASAHPTQGTIHPEPGRFRASSPPGEPCASRVTFSLFSLDSFAHAARL
jgi:hypothetical protein